MAQDEGVIVYLLNGYGTVPDDFEGTVADGTLCGLPMRLKKVGKQPIPGGPPIGVILGLPLGRLSRLGDETTSPFLRVLHDLFQANRDDCNFSLRLMTGGAGGYDIHVSANNLTGEKVPLLLAVLSGDAGDVIADMQVPTQSIGGVYINIDIDRGAVKDATCFDYITQDFYVFDLTRRVWVKQANPDQVRT